MVSTSMKFDANARNTACHKKLLKLIFDLLSEICIKVIFKKYAKLYSIF